jgi:hypothetical protein
LLDVHEIGYSLQGLIEDLKFDRKYWNNFNKIAVVSDKKLVELGAELNPQLEVKYFKHDDKDKAQAWLQ